MVKKNKILIDGLDIGFAELLESTNELVQSVAPDGAYIFVNQAWKDLLGYSDEEILKLNFADVVKKDRLEHCVEIFQELSSGKSHENVETIFCTKDGGEVMVSGNLVPMMRDGKMKMTLGLFRDITSGKYAEMELIQRDQQLEMILRGANIGWWDWDIPSGREIYNEVLPRNLGYELDEIEPNVDWWKDKIHPDDRGHVEASLQKHFDGGTEFYIDKHRLKTRSGEWKWFFDYGKVVERDGDGKPIRMIGTLRDIDEEESSKRALEESESRFRQMSENSVEWIWEVDADGLYTYSSKTVEKILGYKPEEIVGKRHFYDFFPSEARERIKMETLQVFAKRESFKGLVNLNEHRNGSQVYLSTSALPIVSDAGELTGYRGVDVDITEEVYSKKRIEAINRCFLELGTDYDKNIKTITRFCGEMLGAFFVSYGCMDASSFCTQGMWNRPPTYNMKSDSVDSICSTLIDEDKEGYTIIRELQKTPYRENVPMVGRYNLQTYIGSLVRAEGRVVGVLCALFQNDREFSAGELNVFGAFSGALGIEVARHSSKMALQDKLFDVAKLNELMFGRERRVLELKEEVNRLLEKMGRETKYST